MTEFLPHRICYLYNPWLTGIIGGSDTVIGCAYWLIGWYLLAIYFALHEPHGWALALKALRPWMPLCFGSFILLCGIGHWIDVSTLFIGWYWITAGVRTATAIVSAGTAMACSQVARAMRTKVQ